MKCYRCKKKLKKLKKYHKKAPEGTYLAYCATEDCCRSGKVLAIKKTNK